MRYYIIIFLVMLTTFVGWIYVLEDDCADTCGARFNPFRVKMECHCYDKNVGSGFVVEIAR